MTDLTYISKGNEKTECFSFDIPAVATCPGRTEECEKDCYAAKLTQVYRNVGIKYRRNHEIVFHPGFVDYMIENIPRDCEFRIHVSGDFFHPDYVKKWIEICAARTDVIFYAYTRSWRIPEIWSEVFKLHYLPNVNINCSVDDETGPAKVFGSSVMRWAYLTKIDNAPSWLRKGDIVFRSNHHGRQGNHKWKRKKAIKEGLDPDIVAPLIKRLVGQVCPMEQGQDMPDLSCKKCRLCVDKPGVYANV